MKKQLLNVEKNRKNFLPVFKDKLIEYCSLYNSRSHETCRDGYGKTRAKSIFFEKKPDRARFLRYEKRKRGALKKGERAKTGTAGRSAMLYPIVPRAARPLAF